MKERVPLRVLDELRWTASFFAHVAAIIVCVAALAWLYEHFIHYSPADCVISFVRNKSTYEYTGTLSRRGGMYVCTYERNL